MNYKITFTLVQTGNLIPRIGTISVVETTAKANPHWRCTGVADVDGIVTRTYSGVSYFHYIDDAHAYGKKLANGMVTFYSLT